MEQATQDELLVVHVSSEGGFMDVEIKNHTNISVGPLCAARLPKKRDHDASLGDNKTEKSHGGCKWLSTDNSEKDTMKLMGATIRRKRLEIRRFRMSMMPPRKEPFYRGADGAGLHAVSIKKLETGTPQVQVDVCLTKKSRTDDQCVDSHKPKANTVSFSTGRLPWNVARGDRPVLIDNRCPEFGVVSISGRQREMEDAACAVPAFLELCSADIARSELDESELRGSQGNGRSSDSSIYHLFGVYDGHGGAQVAQFCRENAHVILAREMKQLADSRVDRVEAIDVESNEAMKWRIAFEECFQQLDDQVVGDARSDSQVSTIEPDCISASAWLVPSSTGSTAVVGVVGPDCILVGNCGDSRAVLSRSGRAVPLSSDHKASRPDEVDRIQAAGGQVIDWDGQRVLGVLAMSRAIGDAYLKPYVISKPEVTFTHRSHEDECLIIASDGLWDVVSNEMACAVARKCLSGRQYKRKLTPVRDPQDPASRAETPAETAAAVLAKLALAKGSRDNISVVVVDLKSNA